MRGEKTNWMASSLSYKLMMITLVMVMMTMVMMMMTVITAMKIMMIITCPQEKTNWVTYNLAGLYWRMKGDAFESIECLRYIIIIMA